LKCPKILHEKQNASVSAKCQKPKQPGKQLISLQTHFGKIVEGM
jgi:hypothetical protein